MASELLPIGYEDFLLSIKERVRSAQLRAMLVVNNEHTQLYWTIGRDILQKQQSEGWGTKVIERLSRDLKVSFPQMQGLSRTNLLYMRAFAVAWPDESIVQRVVGQLPWRHNIALLDKLKDPTKRLWYAKKQSKTAGLSPFWRIILKRCSMKDWVRLSLISRTPFRPRSPTLLKVF